MNALLATAGTKKVLIDPHPAWGGVYVAIAAGVLFAIFAGWIVIQRVRHGREGAMSEGDDDQS
jgi:hypothetical protein